MKRLMIWMHERIEGEKESSDYKRWKGRIGEIASASRGDARRSGARERDSLSLLAATVRIISAPTLISLFQKKRKKKSDFNCNN